MRRTTAAVVLLLAASSAGCAANFEETTLVRVRAPARVGVTMETPGGTERVLAADGSTRVDVLEIRGRRVVATQHGERTGAALGVAVGATFAALGAAVAIGVSIDQREVSGVGCALGGAFVAGGLFFLLTGLRGLNAKDE